MVSSEKDSTNNNTISSSSNISISRKTPTEREEVVLSINSTENANSEKRTDISLEMEGKLSVNAEMESKKSFVSTAEREKRKTSIVHTNRKNSALNGSIRSVSSHADAYDGIHRDNNRDPLSNSDDEETSIILQDSVVDDNEAVGGRSIAELDMMQSYAFPKKSSLTFSVPRQESIIMKERKKILGKNFPASLAKKDLLNEDRPESVLQYLRRTSIITENEKELLDIEASNRNVNERKEAQEHDGRSNSRENQEGAIELNEIVINNNDNPVIEEQPLSEEEQRFRELKKAMLIDLDTKEMPILKPKQHILPTELDAIRAYAIAKKVAKREKKLNKWRKRARTMKKKITIKYSHSMDEIANAKSSIESNYKTIKSKLKRICFVGPCWKPVTEKKTKVYDVTKEDMTDVKATIIDLGYALSIYGIPAHRLEYHLALVSSFYGINCTSYSTPTGLWIMFGHYVDDPDASIHFIRITSSSLNLSKLCMIDDVADKISRGALTIPEVRKKIRDIITLRPMYTGFIFNVIISMVQAICYSVFFSATWGEAVASLVAGLFVGLISEFGGRFETISQVTTIICAVAAGIIGVIFKLALGKVVVVSAFIVSLSGVISLLPGLTITISVAEISTRNMMSGGTRLIFAFITIVQLGFGVLMANTLGTFFQKYLSYLPNESVRAAPPIWMPISLIPVLIITMIMQLKSPRYPLAILFIVLDTFCGYIASYYATKYLGSDIGACAGAFVVGVIANIFSMISRHPSIVVSSIGIMLLLPGSLSYKSVNAFLNNDATSGITFLFQAIETALSITAGLLLSDIFALRRKKLSL